MSIAIPDFSVLPRAMSNAVPFAVLGGMYGVIPASVIQVLTSLQWISTGFAMASGAQFAVAEGAFFERVAGLAQMLIGTGLCYFGVQSAYEGAQNTWDWAKEKVNGIFGAARQPESDSNRIVFETVQACQREILEDFFHTHNYCCGEGVVPQKNPWLTKIHSDGHLIDCNLRTGQTNDPQNFDILRPAILKQLRKCWPAESQDRMYREA